MQSPLTMQAIGQTSTMGSLAANRPVHVAQRPFAPARPLSRGSLRHRTLAVRMQAKSKMHEFDLTQTDYRKTGMESEKVDGTITRLWKFFFRPGEGYVDRYGFSVPMGPLDDVSLSTACLNTGCLCLWQRTCATSCMHMQKVSGVALLTQCVG